MRNSGLRKASILLGLFVLAGSTVPARAADPEGCVEPPRGLLSWWTGDGTADDLMGVNHGALEGDATFGPGLVGDAFLLDGDGDAVALPDLDSQLPPVGYSYALWVKLDVLLPSPFAPRILGSWIRGWDDLIVFTGAGARPLYVIHQESVGSCNLFIADLANSQFTDKVRQWVFLAVTYGDDQITLYMNDKSDTTACTLASSRRIRFIGRSETLRDDVNFFPDAIDEVQIYTQALSAAELLAMYEAGPAGTCKRGAITNLAIQKTQDIMAQIVSLNLHKGIRNSLDAKFDNVLRALEDMNDNNDIAAINALEAAKTSVSAQSGGKISETDAEELTASLQEVIDLLNQVL